MFGVRDRYMIGNVCQMLKQSDPSIPLMKTTKYRMYVGLRGSLMERGNKSSHPVCKSKPKFLFLFQDEYGSSAIKRGLRILSHEYKRGNFIAVNLISVSVF